MHVPWRAIKEAPLLLELSSLFLFALCLISIMPPRRAPSVASEPASRAASPSVEDDEVGRVAQHFTNAAKPTRLLSTLSTSCSSTVSTFRISRNSRYVVRTSLYASCAVYLSSQSAAINTVSGVIMTTRRQMLKIKVSLLSPALSQSMF
jgi:hypothetical protein